MSCNCNNYYTFMFVVNLRLIYCHYFKNVKDIILMYGALITFFAGPCQRF